MSAVGVMLTAFVCCQHDKMGAICVIIIWKTKVEEEDRMKVTRLVIGIVSFLMALLVMFQSCAAGLGNALEENGESGGSAGFMLALLVIVAGIIAIATRNGEGKGPYVAAVFYILGGIIGIALAGSYSDLYIWAAVCLIFAAVFIIGTIVERKRR